MKLVKTLTLLGIMAGLGLVVVAEQGCSSSATTAPTTGDQGVGGPPAKPSAPATTSSDFKTFAVSELYFGDTDRSGSPNSNAWKTYGYNLDGKATTDKSTDVCTLESGASKTTQTDGDQGRDNSFGKNIVPIITSVAGSDFGKKVTDSIKEGSFTVLLDIKGLTGEKQTNIGLSGQLFAGGNFDQAKKGAKPTFTTADDWPLQPELLNGATAESGSKIQLTDAYIVNGTFVAQASKITLSLSISGQNLSITINKAVITMDVSGSEAKNGTIAGVINTEELINGLKSVAGRISTSLCKGDAFENIAQQLRQASDINSDGTNTSGAKCTGISVGLGFNAKQIGRPKTVAAKGSDSPDPCKETPDAGADSGSAIQDAGGGG